MVPVGPGENGKFAYYQIGNQIENNLFFKKLNRMSKITKNVLCV